MSFLGVLMGSWADGEKTVSGLVNAGDVGFGQTAEDAADESGVE
jgi:hypothetical protein